MSIDCLLPSYADDYIELADETDTIRLFNVVSLSAYPSSGRPINSFNLYSNDYSAVKPIKLLLRQ